MRFVGGLMALLGCGSGDGGAEGAPVGVETRLVLDGERVIGEERLLVDRGRRIRDVRQGPDGALWVLTDEDDGELLRISPAGEG